MSTEQGGGSSGVELARGLQKRGHNRHDSEVNFETNEGSTPRGGGTQSGSDSTKET